MYILYIPSVLVTLSLFQRYVSKSAKFLEIQNRWRRERERERALCVSKTGIASCLLMYGGGPFLVSYQWATGEFWGILPPYTLRKVFLVYSYIWLTNANTKALCDETFSQIEGHGHEFSQIQLCISIFRHCQRIISLFFQQCSYFYTANCQKGFLQCVWAHHCFLSSF